MTTEQIPYDVALARVRSDDDLYPHKDVLIDYDWDNEDEHYGWVATADKAEILSWIASFRDDIATQQERDELLDKTSKAIEQEWRNQQAAEHRKDFE